VVLKAVAKGPAERYATARELADDLRRFVEDRPIQARRPTLRQRLARTARRRPRTTAALLLAAAAVLAGAWWWDRQRAQTEGAARQVAEQADELFRRRRFPEAEAVARRAADLLPRFGGDAGLRRRVGEMVADLSLLRRLDEARLGRVNLHLEMQSDFGDPSSRRWELDSAPVATRFAAAFREEYGLDVFGGDEPAVLAGLGRRAIRVELVAALDDWACDVKDPEACLRLLRLADALDPDKDGVASRWRRLSGAAEADELRRLAAEAEANPPPPAFLVRLAWLVAEVDQAAAVRLMRLARQRQPDDQCINGALAQTLMLMGPDHAAEALRFWTAAQALRPDSTNTLSNLGSALISLGRYEDALEPLRLARAIRPDHGGVRNNLGLALSKLGRLEEAAEEFRRVVELSPNNSGAWYNLGCSFHERKRPADAAEAFRKSNALRANVKACFGLSACLAEMRRFPEAEAAGREAVKLDPTNAEAHFRIAIALGGQGRDGEAIAAYRKSIQLKPWHTSYFNMGSALARLRQYAEAEAAFRQAILLKPDYARAHRDLGKVLLGKGDPTGAVEALRGAIRLDPGNANIHFNLGNALTEMKDSDGALRAYRKAIDLQPDYVEAHYNLGHVLRFQKNREGAVAAYRKATQLKPDLAEAHCNLGIVLREQGRFAEALSELRRGHELGSKRPGWRYPSARWVKQCERLVELERRLPSVLEGKAQAENVDETLDFAVMCQKHRQRNAAAARFFQKAFGEQPALAENLQAGHRYNAARAAALAGCSQGQDAAGLADEERSRLRKQALDWLHADLGAWRKLLDKEPDKARPAVAKTIQQWLADTDFAGVRGEAALAKLPQTERPAWQKLWGEVAEMLAEAQPKAVPRKPAGPK
jgi:serine/threonine-protein kinase